MLGFYLLEKYKKNAAQKYRTNEIGVTVLNTVTHLLPLILVNLIYTKKISDSNDILKGLFIYSIFVLVYVSLSFDEKAYDYIEDVSQIRLMLLGSGIFNTLFGLLNY